MEGSTLRRVSEVVDEDDDVADDDDDDDEVDEDDDDVDEVDDDELLDSIPPSDVFRLFRVEAGSVGT